jgi:hypothetical protein
MKSLINMFLVISVQTLPLAAVSATSQDATWSERQRIALTGNYLLLYGNLGAAYAYDFLKVTDEISYSIQTSVQKGFSYDTSGTVIKSHDFWRGDIGLGLDFKFYPSANPLILSTGLLYGFFRENVNLEYQGAATSNTRVLLAQGGADRSFFGLQISAILRPVSTNGLFFGADIKVLGGDQLQVGYTNPESKQLEYAQTTFTAKILLEFQIGYAF